MRGNWCVAVCKEGGGNKDCRAGGELNEDLKFADVKMSAFRGVEPPKSLNGAESLGRVSGIFVRFAANLGAKVKRGARVGVGVPGLYNSRVVFAQFVDDLANTFVRIGGP